MLFLNDFQYLEKSSLIVLMCSLVLLVIWGISQHTFQLEDDFFIRKIPAKIRLPITESFIYKTGYFLGFILFIFSILSIPVTWIFWLCGLGLSVCWASFFYHPHVWAKDSVDVMDRIHHPDQYKDHEDGYFKYPIEFEGFEYLNESRYKEASTVLWNDILSIDAVMIDLGVYSEIRLIILTQKEIIQIDESTSGYLKFFKMLQEHLENFDSMKMLVYMSAQFSHPINVYKK